MKISEYDLLQEAFTRSFGFMLNRVWEVYELSTDPHEDPGKRDHAEERCFNEFMCALEEMGVELETVGRYLLELQTKKPLPPPGEEE